MKRTYEAYDVGLEGEAYEKSLVYNRVKKFTHRLWKQQFRGSGG